MLQSETAQILSIASAIDNRKVTLEAIAAWHEVIGHLDYEDARSGLKAHRTNQPGVYLEPGHIVQAVRLERRQRYGIHPPAPEGTVWAVDAIMNDPAYDDPKELEQ